eukprot:scaffold39337_cov68-Phaeocystis_antarctica.AAC.1
MRTSSSASSAEIATAKKALPRMKALTCCRGGRRAERIRPPRAERIRWRRRRPRIDDEADEER